MDNKIIDYDILSSTDLVDLAKSVKAALSRGWQPYGDPFSAPVKSPFSERSVSGVAQAMVKYES